MGDEVLAVACSFTATTPASTRKYCLVQQPASQRRGPNLQLGRSSPRGVVFPATTVAQAEAETVDLPHPEQLLQETKLVCTGRSCFCLVDVKFD